MHSLRRVIGEFGQLAWLMEQRKQGVWKEPVGVLYLKKSDKYYMQ